MFRPSFIAFFFCLYAALAGYAVELPWSHGQLMPSSDGAYLQHSDGTPFFWLGDTGWLLPEKLDRQQTLLYLDAVADNGYNVVQVQTINGVPAVNVYGQLSHTDGWDFSDIDKPDVYGYWDHMDYIIDQARQRGIYVAMVCIWGGLVKGGKMDVDQARAYGSFLGSRYRDVPNVVWVIGGDIKGDVKPEVWQALADAIRLADSGHLMSFHPFGRTSSAYWWHDAQWLDFNMFQSGHRRYDQTRGDGDDTAAASVAEDNWRYVDDAISRMPRKPVIDAEPSYEGIPQGLHDTTQPLWQAHDVRRYAYWSVFAGAAGHTYGNNSVMQMFRPGDNPAYGASVPWYEALKDPGYGQMQHLKNLIMMFPFFERVPDQSIVASPNGMRYDRAIATRGDSYLLVYNYSNKPVDVDLSKISGPIKCLWWYNPENGEMEYIGEHPDGIVSVCHPATDRTVDDWVLVAVDSSMTEAFSLPVQQVALRQ